MTSPFHFVEELAADVEQPDAALVREAASSADNPAGTEKSAKQTSQHQNQTSQQAQQDQGRSSRQNQAETHNSAKGELIRVLDLLNFFGLLFPWF